jgi:hypothetical protein
MSKEAINIAKRVDCLTSTEICAMLKIAMKFPLAAFLALQKLPDCLTCNNYCLFLLAVKFVARRVD